MLFLKYLLKEFYHAFRTAPSRKWLWLLLRFGDAPRYQHRSVRFLDYRFQVPDCLSFVWQFKEIFVDELYRFETSHPNPVIYDCGANIGTSCVYFSRLYPQACIRAFEADPKVAHTLRLNMEFNGISHVEITAKAVWIDEEGIALVSEGSDAASIFGQGEKTAVPSVRFRDLLLGEARVDMLKIDIEGAEADVLHDCRDALSHVQHIFVEYHAYPGRPQQLDQVLHILTESGFRYYISSAQQRPQPFVQKTYLHNGSMDLQLNIFGYRTAESS